MLSITIPESEQWDEGKQEFIRTKSVVLQLEHSLISISKWESKWQKVFLSKEEKSIEETIDYVRCMTIGAVDPDAYYFLSSENFRQINQYIESSMSVTFFTNEPGGRPNREQVTSELIYYWMIALNIPFECEKWHLNRLLTLIRVCNLKNRSPKKRSKREIMNRNSALNAARRQQLNSSG